MSETIPEVDKFNENEVADVEFEKRVQQWEAELRELGIDEAIRPIVDFIASLPNNDLATEAMIALANRVNNSNHKTHSTLDVTG